MSYVWLWLFLLACLGCVTQGLKGSDRHYEPLLPMSSIFIGFVWIQLHGLWRNEWLLPDGALAKTAFMSLLCVLSFWWGYSRQTRPLQLFRGPYNLDRLFWASLGLTVFGASFFYMISRLPEELLLVSQPSGKLVAMIFFAQTLTYGFALSCLLWAKYGDRKAFWVALFGTCFYIDRIVLAGRRQETAELFFIIILSLLFGRGKKLPKWAMVTVMVVMVLIMHSTGSYRDLAVGAKWDAPLLAGSINYVKNLKDVFLFGGEEMRNAVYMIEGYDRSGDFDFGLSHWNQLIFNYVPAQLVGSDVKASLQFNITKKADAFLHYEAKTGSTATGMVDSFGSFWYLGALKFAIIGVIIRKVWNGARAGSLGAQLLYMLLITKTLHTITHNTQWFVSPWVHMAIFLFPLLLWARNRGPSRHVGEVNMLVERPTP